jgi:hypothetical protein
MRDDSPAARTTAAIMARFAGKIPLYPPFSKGEIFRSRLFPLLEKEGLGEIFDSSNHY